MATFRNRHGKWQARGRPPSGYAQLDLTDPEQLAMAITKRYLINNQINSTSDTVVNYFYLKFDH
jgi:hypothetical protein